MNSVKVSLIAGRRPASDHDGCKNNDDAKRWTSLVFVPGPLNVECLTAVSDVLRASLPLLY